MKYLYFIGNMRDTSDIPGPLRGMRHELRKRYHIRSIGIFGSCSRKHQTEQSDPDLVVEFDQPVGMMAFVHLKNDLPPFFYMTFTQSVEKIGKFTQDFFDQLTADERTRDAILRNLQVIGEASKNPP